jgi:hypothetical protein
MGHHMTVTNPEEWDAVAHNIEMHTGVPPNATIDEVAGLVSSAVGLLYAADASGEMESLRGVFSDLVVGQCERNRGCLEGAIPGPGGRLTLVGEPYREDGDPIRAVRVRADFPVTTPAGRTLPGGLFMDVEFGSNVTVAAARNCSNCGAPLQPGELVCSHCGADMRAEVRTPLAIGRLQLQ